MTKILGANEQSKQKQMFITKGFRLTGWQPSLTVVHHFMEALKVAISSQQSPSIAIDVYHIHCEVGYSLLRYNSLRCIFRGMTSHTCMLVA